MVDVADVEAGPLPREAAGPECREAPLARQLGQRVRLVHELAELAAAEELLHRRHDGPDVDEGVRGRLVDLLDRHALADDALHAQEADPEGVLDQLAVGADPAVAEVVDVVGQAAPVVEDDQLADDGRDVLPGDGPAELWVLAVLARQLDPHPGSDRVQLLVELVPAHPAKVVAPEVEEEALHQLAGVVAGRRIARAQLLVDLDQRLGLGVGRVLVEGRRDVRVLGVVVDRPEERRDLLVALVADGPQERGGRDLALAVHLDGQEVSPGGRLELEPGAAVRDHLGGVQVATRRRILDPPVVDARRTHELADHDTLGAVDDERAEVGHPRVVTHVDPLALDLPRLLDQQLDLHVERAAEREVARPALELGVLRVAELVVQELELHHLAGEVPDRADLVEELPEPLLDEPRERPNLELDEIRDLALLDDPGIRDAPGHGSGEISDRQHEPLLGGGGRQEEGPRSRNWQLYRVGRGCQTRRRPGRWGGPPPGSGAATPVERARAPDHDDG